MRIAAPFISFKEPAFAGIVVKKDKYEIDCIVTEVLGIDSWLSLGFLLGDGKIKVVGSIKSRYKQVWIYLQVL